MALVADPDERRRHEPGLCAGCGQDLAGAAEVGMERRQVFDLSPMTVRMTEHQLIAAAAAVERLPAGPPRRG